MRSRALGIWAAASAVLGLLTVVVITLLLTFTELGDHDPAGGRSSARGAGRYGERSPDPPASSEQDARQERSRPQATVPEEREASRTASTPEATTLANRVIEIAAGAPWPDRGSGPEVGEATASLQGAHRIYRRLGETSAPTDGAGGALPLPSLLVRVTAQESGDPLPSASVELTEVDGDFQRTVAELGAERELERLPATTVDVLLRHDSRVPRWARGLRLERGYEYLLDVDLAVGRVLNGLVDLEEFGSPLEHAEVRAWTADEFWAEWPLGERVATALRATTDRYGRYELHALPRSETFVVEVRGKGAATHYARFSTNALPGSTARNFELARARPLRGTVLGEDGHPVEGAFVFAVNMLPSERVSKMWRDIGMPLTDESSLQLALRDQAMRGGRWSGMFEGAPLRRRTDASGGFEFDDASPGQTPALLGYDPVAGAAAVFADPAKRARLRLGGTTLISVSVRDAGGAAVGGARVWLSPTVPVAELDRQLGGRYGPKRAPVGRVLIVAQRDGLPVYREWGDTTAGSRAVEEGRTHFEIHLDPPEVITGVVLDPLRHPISGATVSCDGTEVSVAESGRFRLQGPAEGQHDVHVSAPGFAARWIEVNVPAHDVEVVLEPTEHIPLRLVLPPGIDPPLWSRVAVAQVRAGEPEGTRASIRHCAEAEWADGQVVLEADAARPCVAYVLVPGCKLERLEFPPNIRRTTRPLREVQLRPATAVEGRVEFAEFHPARGVGVIVEELPPAPLTSTFIHLEPIRTDEHGRYRFFLSVPAGLRTGSARVSAHAEHHSPVTAIVEDTPDGPAVKLLRFRPFLRLNGRVVSATGSPEEDAPVMSGVDRVRTDAEGRFSLVVRELPARLYFGPARSNGFTHASLVRDESGTAQRVELVLSDANVVPRETE